MAKDSRNFSKKAQQEQAEKAQKANRKRKAIFVIIGVIVLVTIAAVIFVSHNADSNSVSGAAAISPTPIQAWEDFKTEVILAKSNQYQAVRDAAANWQLLIDQKSITWPDCANIHVYVDFEILKSHYEDVMMGTSPQGFGTGGDGKDGIKEQALIDPGYFESIPQGQKWSHLWHEMLHLHQDCSLMSQVMSKTGLRDQPLWNEFFKRWQAAAATAEAYPLAVQVYWYRHGNTIHNFVMADQLLAKMPGVWSKELPLDSGGVPEGIISQPEWAQWVALINSLYVVR